MKITLKAKHIEKPRPDESGIKLRLKQQPYSFLVDYMYDPRYDKNIIYINDKITNTRYMYKNPSYRKYQRALFRAVISNTVWIRDYMAMRLSGI